MSATSTGSNGVGGGAGFSNASARKRAVPDEDYPSMVGFNGNDSTVGLKRRNMHRPRRPGSIQTKSSADSETETTSSPDSSPPRDQSQVNGSGLDENGRRRQHSSHPQSPVDRPSSPTSPHRKGTLSNTPSPLRESFSVPEQHSRSTRTGSDSSQRGSQFDSVVPGAERTESPTRVDSLSGSRRRGSISSEREPRDNQHRNAAQKSLRSQSPAPVRPRAGSQPAAPSPLREGSSSPTKNRDVQQHHHRKEVAVSEKSTSTSDSIPPLPARTREGSISSQSSKSPSPRPSRFREAVPERPDSHPMWGGVVSRSGDRLERDALERDARGAEPLPPLLEPNDDEKPLTGFGKWFKNRKPENKNNLLSGHSDW